MNKMKLFKILEPFLSMSEAIKYSDGEISKKGGVGEFLKGNGAGLDKYDGLKGYKSLLYD
ncbi:MAG: hypothetical protein V8S08_04800 [Lachnoclostridium sp.]